MNSYLYKGFSITVLDDSNHRFGSSENQYNYAKYYFGNSKNIFPVSRHGILVFKDQMLYNSGMVIGFAGNTFATENSFVQYEDFLLLCCCNMVFCLELPNLELVWKEELDDEACYKIQKLENDFLVLGKHQITCLNKTGRIKWQYQCTSINDQTDSIYIEEDSRIIKIKTLEGTEFCLSFLGTMEQYNKRQKSGS